MTFKDLKNDSILISENSFGFKRFQTTKDVKFANFRLVKGDEFVISASYDDTVIDENLEVDLELSTYLNSSSDKHFFLYKKEDVKRRRGEGNMHIYPKDKVWLSGKYLKSILDTEEEWEYRSQLFNLY